MVNSVLRFNILTVFFCFYIFSIKAQEKHIDKIKISRKAEKISSKEKIVKRIVKEDTTLMMSFQTFAVSRRISNYITEIPGNCEDIEYEISAKYKGSLKTEKVEGNMFSVGAGIILNELTPGDFFYIDTIHTKCAKPNKKLYKILLK
mgnify:CR=1 FL=1